MRARGRAREGGRACERSSHHLSGALTDPRGARPAGTNLISTDWVAKQLVLAPGLNSVPIDSSVAGLVDGPYLAADFVFWNAWTIQAFCQTANAFLYTTPAGVVSRPSAPAAMPPDYGPLEYDFMAGFGFVSTRGSDSAANSAAQGHQSFINSAVAYTVGNGTAVQLLVDPSHVVSCYDGTAAAGDHAGLLPPFGFDQRVGQATPVLPFAWAAPAFSLQNWLLPVFVDVSSSPGGGAAATVGETYAFAASPAALPAAGGAPVDWSALVIASATWGGAGAAGAPLLDMRVRGSGGGWSAPSLGFASSGPLFNFTQAAGGGGGSWGAFNGPQYPGSYEMMRARVLSGFARPAAGDYTTVGSASVADGPECGAATGTQGGEVRYGTCLNGTVTIYYVQLQRGT